MTALKTLKSQNGASSVLVIFMMMVLITFGALAITSANVNYKLSRRTLEWNAMYYELDGEGEQFISALDAKLAKAEKKAVDYALDEGYIKPEYADIAPDVQSAVFSAYNDSNLTETEALNKIYLYYADIFVNELLLDFNGIEVYPFNNESFIESIYAEANFRHSSQEHENCSLRVSVSIEPLEYEKQQGGAGVSFERESGLRYTIEDWYEYQEPPDVEEPVQELWDGSL